MEITVWAQEHLQKSFSVNTVHSAIHKCTLKLCHAKKRLYMNMIQNGCHLLWAKTHLKLRQSEKLFCGQTNQNLKFLFEIMNAATSKLNRSGII